MSAELPISGNLGQDPELRYTTAGEPICNLSVAMSRKWTGKDGQKHEETTWVRVVVFGKQAEDCNQRLKKGNLVYVLGRLKPEIMVFQRKDGTNGAAYEVIANSVWNYVGTKD